MKKYLTLALIFLSYFCFAQNLNKPSAVEIATLPQWAQLMYAENPNVFEVDQAFAAYYRQNLFQKNYHTQYYKKWRRLVDPYIQSDGYFQLPTAEELIQKRAQTLADATPADDSKNGNWSLLGPRRSYNTSGNISGQHSNIYSLDQSLSDPNIMYCGTEPGEIYRSDDEGLNWNNVSLTDPLGLTHGIHAIKIHPVNPDIVLAGAGPFLFRTTNGGESWSMVLSGISRVNEIVFLPSSPNIALIATHNGLYRSTNAGQDCSLVFSGRIWDIKHNTANDQIIYVARGNTQTDLSEFYISEDAGMTYTIQTEGWHTSDDPGRHDGGVRLAVTKADPNRVYAHLIGESKTDDSGFIGLYRSDDGGHSWVLPNGPPGGPYDENHINLAVANVSWNYHQGYYNCALMCSNSNPDEIFVGGLSLYHSTDAGASFTARGGYASNEYPLHVDMQDFRAYDSTSWITTDGGIYRSVDFFNTPKFEVRMTGIHSADYWGFGQGWNEDITVGGLYHNGVHSSFDLWGLGESLQLGGGEPASGYVNPGESRKVYSTQLGGRVLPLEIGEPVTSFQFGINPNESYWGVQSSELEFDPRCYHIGYTGKDHQLWKTTDQGSIFNLFHSFGDNPDHLITYIEIAWSDPDVMYVCQQLHGTGKGKLWKTADGGSTWSEITLPTNGNTLKMLVQVDPENADIVYIAFQSTGNGQRIYKSVNGGASWTNLTTSALDGQNAKSIAVIGGTDGGIYYATDYRIYYRNNSMSDWENFADGLPVKINTNIIRPLYRDSKIRLASYGRGIWESPLFENPSRPIAQASVDRLVDSIQCDILPFHYIDHSIVNHNGTSWEWEFQGGQPATASGLEATVTYDQPGTYLSILTVTDVFGNVDTDSLYVTIAERPALPTLSEDFEGSFPPANFEIINPDDDIGWSVTEETGGFGLSSRSMMINNYYYAPINNGQRDDAQVLLGLSNLENIHLTFDLAYTYWSGGEGYTDSLEVLVSTNCGETFERVYYEGGETLATRPAIFDWYVPTAEDWRTDTIDLNAYSGVETILLKIRNISGYGNNLYIDNINLHADQITATENPIAGQNEVQIFPNPMKSGTDLQIRTPYQESIWIDIYQSDGKMIYKQQHPANTSISTQNWPSGLYLCVIRSERQIQKKFFVVD